MMPEAAHHVGIFEPMNTDELICCGAQVKLDKFIPANSYINYFDANVTGGAAAYYTGAYPRLQGIKRKYDPGNYFNYPGSIAVS